LGDNRLAELAEAEWKIEAEQARKGARERGLNQGTIDEATHDLRSAGKMRRTLICDVALPEVLEVAIAQLTADHTHPGSTGDTAKSGAVLARGP
jgi:hypothetical protein